MGGLPSKPSQSTRSDSRFLRRWSTATLLEAGNCTTRPLIRSSDLQQPQVHSVAVAGGPNGRGSTQGFLHDQQVFKGSTCWSILPTYPHSTF